MLIIRRFESEDHETVSELHTTKQPEAQSLFLKNGYTLAGRKPWRDVEMLFYEKTLL